MKRRITQHNGRTKKDGTVYNPKHNDRNSIGYDSHIDKSLSGQNKYWRYYADCPDNETAERAFYSKHFADSLNAQNERYLANRHPERVKTIDDYRGNARTCPEETLLQIGNRQTVAIFGKTDTETLWACVMDQLAWEQEQFPQRKILSVSLHADEPDCDTHVHVRAVWVADGPDGQTVSQKQALAQMGINAPRVYSRGEAMELVRQDADFMRKQPTPAEFEKQVDKALKNLNDNKHNNAKMTFSERCRGHWFKTCIEHGIQTERTPKEASKSGLDFVAYKEQKELENARNEYDRILHQTKELLELKAQLAIKSDRGKTVKVNQAEYNEIVAGYNKLLSEHQRTQNSGFVLSERETAAREATEKAAKAINAMKAKEKALEEAYQQKQKLLDRKINTVEEKEYALNNGLSYKEMMRQQEARAKAKNKGFDLQQAAEEYEEDMPPM